MISPKEYSNYIVRIHNGDVDLALDTMRVSAELEDNAEIKAFNTEVFQELEVKKSGKVFEA